MFRLLIPALFAAHSWAQTAPAAPSGQPPADIDHALRARVAQFYNLIVKHEYRQAEELVAPDSRDFYYEHDKPRYLSFEISSIKWSENFTHAEVVVTTKAPSFMPMSPTPSEQPVTGVWRLLDGAWYWAPLKVSVTDLMKNMYGVPTDSSAGGGVFPISPAADTARAEANAGAARPPLPSNANLPGGMGQPDSMNLGMTPVVGAGLHLDRSSVSIAPSSSEKIGITNGGQGPMTFFILGGVGGVVATFEPPSIKPGEKAVLTLKAGPNAKSGPLLIGVTETKEIVSVPVAIK